MWRLLCPHSAQKDMFVIKKSKCINKGFRNSSNGLWDVHIPHIKSVSKSALTHPLKQSISSDTAHQNVHVPQSKQHHTVNAIIWKTQTKSELWSYLHGCCGSPALSTWRRAIKNGNFITWPGITSISMYADSHATLATDKCHLDQEREIYNPPSLSKKWISFHLHKHQTSKHTRHALL